MIRSIKNICAIAILLPILAIHNSIQPMEGSSPFFLRIDNAWSEPKNLDLNATALQNFIKKNSKKENTTNVRDITLHTASGLEVPMLFFDRNSDTILLIGQGLPAPKEVMYTHANLFSDYDVILFDYRWNDNYGSFLFKSLALCSPTQRILLDEEEEVCAVLDFLHKHKDYAKIIGLGECYSNFLFAKIQADEIKKSGHGPFTHLILDSCWHSFKSFAESICDDPFLPISPQEGGAPWILKAITGCSIVKWPLLKIVFILMHNVSIEEHLSHLDIPALFIYGVNDLFVHKDHFETIHQASKANKRAAFLTPYQHADNLHNKSLYRFICEQFINASSLTEFIDNCDDLIPLHEK
jgi:hypothetical protein